MRERKETAAEATETVTIRLRVEIVRRLEARAAVACMSRSAFIGSLLDHEDPEEFLPLAALGRLIAIERMVRDGGEATPDLIAELGKLVRELTLPAREAFR
ncbi:hypothetical protein [Sphingomonas parva]|uniref:hypothetical protein n=1 Tax=Sphingomonas parva TaxID=2555898 RepID=UPI001CDB8C40|nr:hypothetical protein [Sphingomonas parva]